LFEDGKSVQLWEHDVENDDIVLAIAGVPKCGLPVGGFIDGITCLTKALDEGVAKGLEIFNY
jgi:hypothetical protein